MIFVVNGMYKSGSTYLYDALRLSFSSEIDDIGERSKFNSLNPSFTLSNIERISRIERDVVIKAHTYSPRALGWLVNRSDTCVIFSYRNLSDSLRSLHFHFKNEGLRDISYFWFLLLGGCLRAIEIECCNRTVLENGLYHISEEYSDSIVSMAETIAGRLRDSKFINKEGFILLSENAIRLFGTIGNGSTAVRGKRERQWFLSRDRSSEVVGLTLFLERLVIWLAMAVGRSRFLRRAVISALTSIRKWDENFFK